MSSTAAMLHQRPLDCVYRMSHFLSHSCRHLGSFGLRPPFPRCVVLAQTIAAVLVGIILFGPLFARMYCGDDHESLLVNFLSLPLYLLGASIDSTSSRAISIWPVALVVNYAYLCGFLFSLGDPLGFVDFRSNNHPYSLISDKNANGRESISSGPVAHAVVGLAFNSGRAQSFTWPPAASFGQTADIAVLRKHAFGSALLQRVYPLTLITVVLPLLVYLFYAMSRGLLLRLGHFTLGTCSSCRTCSNTASKAYAKRSLPNSPSAALTVRHPSTSSHTLLLPGNTSTTTRGLLRGTGPEGMTPPSLFRVSGRALIGILKVASSTLAGGAVETLAPIVFGTILIVTTATALVLYGIGHVGVASLTESGVFGLTKDAVDTLLGLVRMQWRFVRQLRWSWWLNTAARYEQRYEDHVLGAGSAHHGTSIVQDTVYPIHTFHDRDIHTCNNAASNCFLPWSHRPGNGHVGVANGHQDAEDSGVEASVRNHKQHIEDHARPTDRTCHGCHIHHHHHHHHHLHRIRRHTRSRSRQNQESQPGSHIRLDKRRDWVRWFFGLPRMTTIDDPQQPLAPLTSAAVEIARGLLEQQDMMQPGTDGLIPGDKAAEDLIEQRRRPRQANAKSGSRTHVFVNDRGAGHFDSGSSYNARTWLDETVVSDGDTAFSRYGPNPRGSLPTVGTSDAPSRFDMNGSGTDNYHW